MLAMKIAREQVDYRTGEVVVVVGEPVEAPSFELGGRIWACRPMMSASLARRLAAQDESRQ
jgi:hypothetical protein